MSLSAADIVLIMEAAAKHGVLSFKAGDTEFTLKGYVLPQPAPSAVETIQKELQAGRDWAASEPPPYVEEL